MTTRSDIEAHMDAMFAFKIGDLVQLKADLEAAKIINGTTKAGRYDAKPKLGVVHLRIADECHGGVQRHYVVRWHVEVNGNVEHTVGLNRNDQVSEFELVAYVPSDDAEGGAQ